MPSFAERVRDLLHAQRAERDAAKTAVLDMLASLDEIYSVQLAKHCGWEGSRGVSRAKTVLKLMEREGVLVSELRLPKRGEGGPGRRFYRLTSVEVAPTSEASAQPA